MIEYPSIPHVDRLEHYFSAIRVSEVPKRFTYRYFASLGFSSSQDRPFVELLKFLEFIDFKGVPEDVYMDLRSGDTYKAVIKSAVLAKYANVVHNVTDLTDVSRDGVADVLGRVSKGGLSALLSQADTFLALVNLSELHLESLEPSITKEKNLDTSLKDGLDVESTSRTLKKPTLNLSINLPTTTDERVYESLFKHLRDLIG